MLNIEFFWLLLLMLSASITGSIIADYEDGIRIFLVYKSIDFAIVVSISLISTVIISKLVGSVLPLVATKLKLDPAIMAAPLITTVVDTCSIIIYFKIATLVFAL